MVNPNPRFVVNPISSGVLASRQLSRSLVRAAGSGVVLSFQKGSS